MTWATRHQLVFLGFAGIIFLTLAGFFSAPYIFKAPSCSDGKQNGTETGIDCGGSCSTICKNASLPLSIEWSRFFTVTPGVVSVVAYVTNPNPTLSAENVPYIFHIYDEKNILIAERKGNALILPSASFPIFEGGITVGTRIPAKAFFEFTGAPVWKKQVSIALTVTDTSLSEPAVSPRLTATIHNDGLVSASNVDVVAVIYDILGNAMAGSETTIDRVPSGGASPVIFTWPSPFSGASGRIEIYPKVLKP